MIEIVKFYAKSKSNEKNKEEIESINNEKFKYVEEYLTKKEIEIVNKSIENISLVKDNNQKTLDEHTNEIINCCKNFFKEKKGYFTDKEEKLIEIACKYHDYGKVDINFQNKVQKIDKINKKMLSNTIIPHGHLSIYMVPKDGIEEKHFEALITAIYHHHDRKESGIKDIDEYVKKYVLPYLKKYTKEEFKIKYSTKNNVLFIKYQEPQKIDTEQWYMYLKIKGMLNKFDWSVSAGYNDSEIIYENIENFICNKIELNDMQKFMNNNKNKNLVVIASTGSGKTEGACMWISNEKGFYTLPLRVSSNAIYDRLKIKYNYEKIGLLHSSSINKYISDENEEMFDDYEKAKLLSFPLTISTVDQLFIFVYKALGTEVLPATLKYSKIVLDEIQSYDARIIAEIVYGLKVIKDLGGKFCIITATFSPVIQYFMEKEGLIDKDCIIKNYTKNDSRKRHIIDICDDFKIEEILEKGLTKKVLIICNTVKKAQELYEKVISKEFNDVYLLHSKFINKHRKMLENSIMKFSDDETKVGIWICTQIVEVSLDIDFDILYTEMSTADSLLQRMGRCNRKERYIPKTPNIVIIKNASGIGSIYDKSTYNRSLNKLEKYINKIFKEEDKSEYINDVYDINDEEVKNSTYYRKIEENLKNIKNIKVLSYSKDEAKRNFRNIRSKILLPESEYNKNEDIIKKYIDILNCNYITREFKEIIKDKLLSFTLSYNEEYLKNIQINSKPINKNIYITYDEYEFDEKELKGQGFIENKEKCFML